jgi:sensor histidine kinase YesM
MNAGLAKNSQPCDKPSTEKEAMRAIFGWCLWGIPVLAVVIGAFLLIVQHAQLSRAGRGFFSAIVYSIVIGMPSALLLNWLGFRYSDRFPRLILLINTAVLLFMSTVGCLLAGFVFQAIGFMSREYFWLEFKGSLPTCLVISLTVGLGISSFETMRHKLHFATLTLRTQQAEQERAYKLLAEARLSSLASRIHPHFLFNTLNAISTLILDNQNRTANNAVTRLSEFLRYTLDQDPVKKVTLRQEIAALDLYLGTERLRFGERLRLEYAIDGPALDALVPSLLLQPLLENSLKYAVSAREQGGSIRIEGRTRGAMLEVSVIDDGPGLRDGPPMGERRGVGLRNTRERLAVLYGEHHRFAVLNSHPGLRVDMALPLEVAPESSPQLESSRPATSEVARA